MTPLEELKREIESKIPGVKAVIDAPRDPRAGGFLDLHLDDHGAVVEWSPRERRFGVSSLPGTGFGGADEAYDDVASTVLRLVEILKEGQHTDPKELLLNELRDKLGISQEVLAKTLNLRQPTLSKMERRRDVLISTLRKIVEGLGGRLEIAARFPRALVQLVQFTDPGHAVRKRARRKPFRLKADR